MYYNDYNRTDPMAPLPLSLPAEEPKKKPRKGRRAAVLLSLCLASALVGGLAGGAVMGGRMSSSGATTIYESGRAPTAVTVAKVDGHSALTVSEVYYNNLASVVGVNGDVKTNYWGQVVSNPVSGSGFVITSDGYILTNYHVIDGVSDLKVSFADGSTYDATLVGGEEANDIAVLKIDATGLQPVVVGDSTDLKVGEQVVAIGNPLGELTFSLTAGYVSALDRSITMSDGTVMSVLQTDAAINSGNSGGPLFNIYGECIAITNAKYSNNGSTSASIEGIGFAIPLHDVIDMVTDLIEKGYVTGKPSIGVLMGNVSTEATRYYGIPQGAYIKAVLEGGAAQTADIREGDIVTAVGETQIKSSTDLQEAVAAYKAGQSAPFTLYREGQTVTVTVVFDEANLQRSQDMVQLQKDYQEREAQDQQTTSQQQQQQSQSGSSTRPFSSWPFSFFGW